MASITPVALDFPEDANIVLGQSHFIKVCVNVSDYLKRNYCEVCVCVCVCVCVWFGWECVRGLFLCVRVTVCVRACACA